MQEYFVLDDLSARMIGINICYTGGNYNEISFLCSESHVDRREKEKVNKPSGFLIVT